ncbi:MAG: hypothetical protein WBV85_14720 [Solirubrobacteraceae bacterium]
MASTRRCGFPILPTARSPAKPKSAYASSQAQPSTATALCTWAFAELFSQRDRVKHDAELLYLACMLHDLGLTEKHWGHDAHAKCFAVEGARAAHALVHAGGASEERARKVAEAITLHLNVNVPARLGAEANLLSKGVSLDVVGRRLHQIAPSTALEVNKRWPRDGFASELAASTTKQARMRPGSRSALLHKLGFVKLIEGNPFERFEIRSP